MICDCSQWSKSADDATREAFYASEPELFGAALHCKHKSGWFGSVRVASLLCGNIELVDKVTGQKMSFGSVEELICAGWTVD
jgi:hypothetical protein